MRRRKLVCLFMLLCMILGTLAGCGGGTAEPVDNAGTDQPEGPKTLVYARGTDVTTFDLFNNTFISPIIVGKLIQDTLVWQDEKGNFSPYLAEKWEVNDDSTEWTFYLKKGVTFSDGSTFDGNDVKASYEYPVINNLSTASNFNMIDEIQVLDDGYTVKFICSSPNGTLLANLWKYPVMSEEILAKGPDVVSMTPVGTGPYMLDTWELGKNVVLKRNPNFWGEAPYFDVIEHQYVKEENVRLASVQTGIADIAESISADLSKTVADDPNIEILTKTLTDMLWIGIKCDVAPFDDPNVRKALSLCLDRQVFVNLTGGGEVAKGILPSTALGFDPTMEDLKYDLEGAKKLLGESKYNGEEIVLIAFAGSYPKSQEQLEIIQGMMKAAGFNVKFELYDSAGFSAKRAAGEYNLFWTGAAHIAFDPAEFLTARIVNNTMKTNYVNQEMFDLILAGGQTADMQERQKIYEQVVKMMNDESAPFVPTFSYVDNFVINKTKIDLSTIDKAIRSDRIPNLREARGLE